MQKNSILFIIMTLFSLSLLTTKVDAQDYSKLSLPSRLNIIEKKLTATNKVFKILGENKAVANGKIIQKITAGESFELLAVPLIEYTELSKYNLDFTLRLLTERNSLISEISSKTGLNIKADFKEDYGRKKRILEFINPNDKPVIVRFYFIQNKQ